MKKPELAAEVTGGLFTNAKKPGLFTITEKPSEELESKDSTPAEKKKSLFAPSDGGLFQTKPKETEF